MILDAYKKTGLKPKSGAYYYKANISPGVQEIVECCAAGALFFNDYDFKKQERMPDIDDYLNKKYGNYAICGLIYGFDGNGTNKYSDSDTYKIGEELRQELIIAKQDEVKVEE